MSGRKQFDETQVLTAAMTAFWRNGYEATSVSDLEEATGLNKSSLYNAYGSKEELYTRCLDRFAELYSGNLMAQLENEDFKAGIEGFFDMLVGRLESKDVPKGCLATMAAMEVGGGDSAAAIRIQNGLEQMRDAFVGRCQKAVSDGQLPRDTDAAAMGAMLLAMTRGIAVLNRGHPDHELGRAAVRGMLAALDRPARN